MGNVDARYGDNCFVMKKHALLLMLLIVVIFAAWPLFQSRFIPTHDGEYHVIRFYEFYKALAGGYWFPRWASGLNSGYGLPLFIFHYPFPNYVGSWFHAIGASFVDAFKLTLASGYISAVVFCFLWLKKRFAIYAAVMGTIVFATMPYWFVDIYVRGSVGEVLAIAFFMLSLASLEYGRRNLLVFALAGIVLSHNISAMMFFPVVFGYAILRKRMWIESWVLAVALSCYFWFPALWESRYMTGLNTVNFREHFPDLLQLFFPSWGTGFSQIGVPYGEMSQQIGLVALFTIIASGMLVWMLPFVFFMLPISLPVWEFLRPLQFIQFPWRLLTLVIPLAAYSAARLSSKKKPWVNIVLVGFAIVCSWSYMHPVTYEPRPDTHYLTRREFIEGTSSMGNSFSTIWTAWKQERSPQKTEVIQRGENQLLRIHALYYPGWTAWIDTVGVQVKEKDGLIEIPIPEGQHRVFAAFVETPDRYLADAISLGALFWLIGSSILKVYAHRY